jgi:DNA gyrase/topoisomerase IV subunit B
LYEKAKEKQADVKQDESVAKLLVSTKLAATRHIGPKAELFIVEGDSAAGTLKANRDSNYQAILPLRGKVLNSQKATSQKVLDNLELSTLIATLGCGFGDNFDITKLRYGKIIIATDQDVDGLHIRCLLLTFFMNYMPELILQGYVYFLDTPLFVNEMKGKNQKDIYTYSDAEQAEVMKKYRGKIADTLRNKGLGELSEEQVIETILEEKTRKLTRLIVNDEDEVYALIDLLMGDNTQGRKSFFTNQ